MAVVIVNRVVMVCRSVSCSSFTQSSSSVGGGQGGYGGGGGGYGGGGEWS
jgi:hypothetical protein